jgi:uncharacterized membrane protein YphA (DoxX/SURF4 family)
MQALPQAMVSIWSYRAVRLALGVLFIWAAALKLMDLEIFAVTIGAFGLLPKPLVGLAALLLPLIELAAGLGLILDARGSLAVMAGLLIMFALILAYGLWLGLDIDCGCYGPGDPEAEAFSSLRSSLYRDVAMLGGVLYLYWWRSREGRDPLRPLMRIRNAVFTAKEGSA